MYELYTKMMTYFSQHVFLGNIAHVAAGFGIAVLLQHFIKGNSFVPALVGWALVAFAVAVHVMAMMG